MGTDAWVNHSNTICMGTDVWVNYTSSSDKTLMHGKIQILSADSNGECVTERCMEVGVVGSQDIACLHSLTEPFAVQCKNQCIASDRHLCALHSKQTS